MLGIVSMKHQMDSQPGQELNSWEPLLGIMGMESYWTLQTTSTLRERPVEDLMGIPVLVVMTSFLSRFSLEKTRALFLDALAFIITTPSGQSFFTIRMSEASIG